MNDSGYRAAGWLAVAAVIGAFALGLAAAAAREPVAPTACVEAPDGSA